MTLAILRTQPTGSAFSTFLDASVVLRDANGSVEGYPDIAFAIKTYEKIAKSTPDNVGNMILLPINDFFNTLRLSDHKIMYEMYKTCKGIIASMTMLNRREIQEVLQEKVFHTIHTLRLPEKMVQFCKTDLFIYPNLSDAGSKPHHTKEKTFLIEDYIEITAISLLSKMMVPLWGEFVEVLNNVGIKSSNQREKIAFDLIEPTLEEGAFERIYNKLSFKLAARIQDDRKNIDKKSMGNATTSFIITHNSIDDEMFDDIIMATIIVKRMATYECFKLRDGNAPNAMVYIEDGIKRATDSRIKSMRTSMNTMPRRELSDREGTEDNSSILDHASKTSKKPIDVPIFVTTAVEHWELPRLLEETNTPLDVYQAACNYYTLNSFDVSPLCQAMVASFIRIRFGGSKCLGYLTPNIYQRVVVILQIFLIRQGMNDLAALLSSNTSPQALDGPSSPIGLWIQSNLKSDEYLLCQTMFKGYTEKPVIHFGKKPSGRKQEMDTIDFVNHITRMVDWLIRFTHRENMAPALWDFSGHADRPIVGSECRFGETIIQDLCRFYLLFHGPKPPFE